MSLKRSLNLNSRFLKIYESVMQETIDLLSTIYFLQRKYCILPHRTDSHFHANTAKVYENY